MNLNKNETEEFKEILDTISENTLNNAGITKYISAIVYEINENGSCNLYIPPDTKNIITGVPNKSGEYLHIGDSVEVCTKNGKMNNSWIAVKHGNSSGSPTYENLNIINNLNVGGNTQLEGATYVHTAQGTPGTAGYILIATIGVTNSYANAPLHMMIGRRGATPTDFYFGFQNANNTDPGVAYAYCTYPTVDIYYYKEMESTWNIYVKKSELYDHITVLQYEKDITYEGNNYFVLFKDVQDSSLPSGAVYVDSNIYPLGSIYVTSTNNEPTYLGGSWDLIDKEFAPAYDYVENNSSFQTFDNIYHDSDHVASCRIRRGGHTINLSHVVYPSKDLADSNVILMYVKLAYIGLTAKQGQNNIIAYCDGGNSFVMLPIGGTSAGDTQVSITSVDAKPNTITAGTNNIRFDWVYVATNKNEMIDSFCDKFYWKRVLPS